MARQISMEAALVAYRRKLAELVDANVLLEARVEQLELELTQAQAENGRSDSEASA
ncbi:hypothetical protein J1792_16060 [Streptomyces triculaminicus]|uniref:Transposase n=1 Tax=Streptomyces triculaminicus TaxID=2816232 RepID=A0A939FP54_9ACTN|nr:hypothetical protein [Streptomyces triculaminicus]MBO0654231.1 hypothetical protein [Streptomyces triculaminicus]